MYKFFLFCFALVLIDAQQLEAAVLLGKKNDMLNPAQVSNPHPHAGDILLPMPGGLSMAFRAVCIPASGYMDATETQHGVLANIAPDAAQAGGPAKNDGYNKYVDQNYSVSLSAPYELSDFPSAWGRDVVRELQADPACMPSKTGLRPFVYLIGKYEISRAQWRAVTEEWDQEKPFEFVDEDYLPHTGGSWFDVLDFTRRYSEWLMAKHPHALPVFEQENRSSFIRLPSEEEWEFAARGGHKVDPAERARTTLHPTPQGVDIKDCIAARVYDSSLSRPAPIGSRKPNPLGLYDMLGNVAEMVSSPFQLVAGGKRIGGYGGFVIKGGSWLAEDTAALHPGYRIEAAYYFDRKALSRSDLGFRLSIGSILAPKDRWHNLHQEWQERSRPQAALAEPEDDARIAIREVMREIADPVLKQRLAETEAVVSLYYQKVNENEERMIQETVLGALFSLETVVNYAVRARALVNGVDSFDILLESKDVDEVKKTGMLSQKAGMEKDIRGYAEGIRSALFYYLSMIRELSRFSEGRLEPQLEKVAMQFADPGNGFSRNMTRRAEALRGHLNRKMDRLPTERDVLVDVLPAALLSRLDAYW